MLGIAANYPGDKNIGNDPDVLLADNFETYTSPQQLISSGKWSQIKGAAHLRISTEAGHFYSGTKGVELTLPANATSDVDGSVHKDFTPGLPVMYSRAYFRYATDWQHFGSNHNGHGVQGNYPEGGAGTKPNPDGTDFFLFILDNNVINKTLMAGEKQPGFSHFYAYWPRQRTNYGDHFYPDGRNSDFTAHPTLYPDFKPMANICPPLGQWFCSEIMVKVNTIGKNDGELSYWYNGNLAAHFTNLFIRSRESLLIDRVGFGNQANGTTRSLKKWVDNVVLARKYIGPLVKV